MSIKKLFVVIFCAALCCAVFAEEFTFNITSNLKEPFCKVGEKVVFTADIKKDGKPAAGTLVRATFTFNSKTVKWIKKADAAQTFKFEYTPTAPGWVSLRLNVVDEKGAIRSQKIVRNGRTSSKFISAGYGVMVEPEKLAPTMDEPADFDEFWNGVKAELTKTPVKVLDKKTIKHAKLQIYDIKVACAGDKPVSGYLAMPKNAKPKSCPAYVSFHGAGVGSAYIAHSLAASGVITFDINAHGIENGNPRAYYDKLKNEYYLPKGKAGYPHWGKEDRNSFYFKGMFMRVMRALEYVKSLPEWDGKHLIVSGSSQGGAQVLVACAMDKDITLARCEVPAMCDHSGCIAGHVSGWPKLYNCKKGKVDNPKAQKCGSYYDGVFFAKRIKCPIYFSTGGWDFTCPPTSVYRAYNNIPDGVFKSIVFTPGGNHGGSKTNLFVPALNKHRKE